MGKKKAVEESEEIVSPKAKFFEDFADTCFSADYLLKQEKKVISVCPSFDIGTGGIPEGSFIALTGKEKIGKSVLALSIAAKAQRMEYVNSRCPNGRHVGYFNVEHRIKKRDLLGINGLNLSPERFSLIQSSEGNMLSSEDFCTRIERFLNEVPGCVCIIDSFSMLSSSGEQSAEIGYQDRGRSNTIISQLMRKIKDPIAINNCIVIGITQGYQNTSGYGVAFMEKTATSLKFQEDIKLIGKGDAEPWRIGTDEKTPQIGQKTTWQVKFAAISPPGAKICTHLRYNYGIDEVSELIEIGCEYGIISANKQWMSLSFLEGDDAEKKHNGPEQLRKVLLEDEILAKEENRPSWLSILKDNVYSMAGITLKC